ncbi:D-alanine--poly(phosphoribitol) ligase subunit 1 [Streptacidiphilus sp. BW17]|uniref:amino acid adenylation domain-containing protein n=1 Tax=Streptacidiphilus sp. BW17 TaxID=3156274 RepID=UPI0035110A53
MTDLLTAPAESGGAEANPGAGFPTIHAAVAAQAAERPEATAVVFRGNAVDYRTLDAAAGAYAARLAEFGVGPGDVVPVRMPRSPQQFAVLLGVLATGAAYAAFDHRWPADRVAGLLGQLQPKVFVSDAAEVADAAVTSLEDGVREAMARWEPPVEPLTQAAERGGRPSPVEVDATDAACVFFTSGTTGTPKGVVSTHQATTRLFGGPDGLPGYGPGGGTLQAAPCAWDAFSLEVWGMLTTGGTVVISEDDYLLPGVLRDAVADHGVDIVFLTSSLFNLFVDMDLECFQGVDAVYTGGERLSVAHIERFLTELPQARLFNAYGPVESCIYATTHELGLADLGTPGGLPIGVPVAATDVLVVVDGRPAAPREEGEICIGGAGLAQGYLGLPELTVEKFPTLLLDGRPIRVYKTGDLGFHDEDGVLHFRGRSDRQVKVRGYRIEPGEIESAATRVPGVRRAVVVPVPGKTAAWEQIALFYVPGGLDDALEGDVPAGATENDPAGLASALATGLPPYLVPDVIRVVAEFPMTPNGKVDEKALLALLG